MEAWDQFYHTCFKLCLMIVLNIIKYLSMLIPTQIQPISGSSKCYDIDLNISSKQHWAVILRCQVLLLYFQPGISKALGFFTFDIKKYLFFDWLKFHWNLLLRVQQAILVQVMGWCLSSAKPWSETKPQPEPIMTPFGINTVGQRYLVDI